MSNPPAALAKSNAQSFAVAESRAARRQSDCCIGSCWHLRGHLAARQQHKRRQSWSMHCSVGSPGKAKAESRPEAQCVRMSLQPFCNPMRHAGRAECSCHHKPGFGYLVSNFTIFELDNWRRRCAACDMIGRLNRRGDGDAFQSLSSSDTYADTPINKAHHDQHAATSRSTLRMCV